MPRLDYDACTTYAYSTIMMVDDYSIYQSPLFFIFLGDDYSIYHSPPLLLFLIIDDNHTNI
jgi:hypothetical protein